MREEDKALLLAEILGVDTSKYVEKYIEELRSSDAFLMLCENVSKARKSYSYKAQRLINDFEAINFRKINSLQDFFILSIKINYLIQQSEESDYINPFFYNEEVDQIKTVGEISIIFDNNKMNLNDMILDERYTSNYKIDYIKECFLGWRKEVVERVIDQYQCVLVKANNLPSVRGMNEGERNILWISVIYNILFFFLPIIPSQAIRLMYQGKANDIINIIFYIVCLLMFVLDTILIYIIAKKYKQSKEYNEALKVLNKPDKIINEINKKSEKLYIYILSSLTNNKLLDNEISNYSIDKNIINSIIVLNRVLNNPKDEVENESSLLRFVFIIFSFLFLVICVYLIIKIGGKY